MDAYLKLICNGLRLNKIVMCNGTSNVFADLRKLGIDTQTILDELDKNYKIFDQVIEDVNQIGNMLYYLNKYSIISDKQIKLYHSYISFHKKCGLYVFVDPIDAENK